MTETQAIKGAFGRHAHKVAISATKSMVGHTIGAAGVINAFAAIGAIREGVIAPTINLEEPDLRNATSTTSPLNASPGAGRHGDDQRLRVRRPERRRDLQALRALLEPS